MTLHGNIEGLTNNPFGKGGVRRGDTTAKQRAAQIAAEQKRRDLEQKLAKEGAVAIGGTPGVKAEQATDAWSNGDSLCISKISCGIHIMQTEWYDHLSILVGHISYQPNGNPRSELDLFWGAPTEDVFFPSIQLTCGILNHLYINRDDEDMQRHLDQFYHLVDFPFYHLQNTVVQSSLGNTLHVSHFTWIMRYMQSVS